VYFLGIKAAGA